MKQIKVIVEVRRRYEVIVEADLESAAEAEVSQMSVEDIELDGYPIPIDNSSVSVIDATVIWD